jgi:hypothetical protein
LPLGVTTKTVSVVKTGTNGPVKMPHAIPLVTVAPSSVVLTIAVLKSDVVTPVTGLDEPSAELEAAATVVPAQSSAAAITAAVGNRVNTFI